MFLSHFQLEKETTGKTKARSRQLVRATFLLQTAESRDCVETLIQLHNFSLSFSPFVSLLMESLFTLYLENE